DIWDAPADRLHAKKRFRPVASGTVSAAQAYTLMVVMLGLSVAIVLFSGGETRWKLLSIIGIYFFLNIAYCLKLKQITIVDVFIISTGFVLRVLAGGWVTGITLSHWIVLMTFLIALFLAFAKRRDDVLVFERTQVQNRKNINRYNLEYMNQVLSITGVITIISYIMYTVSAEVTTRLKTDYVYITSIFVLAGIFRYQQLTLVDTKSYSPTKILLHDRFIQACVVLWAVFFAIIIYFLPLINK
ncbi:MAG: UbiA prenyltransferase family protein, partial [Bacteroidales bacterium]|nr:UbiA prenyltransferase family protein [Bacteroidales bacterium]